MRSRKWHKLVFAEHSERKYVSESHPALDAGSMDSQSGLE